jgi:DNA-binding NtrC family response regulator
VGDSAVIRRILQTVKTAAPTRATVLLQGESGRARSCSRAPCTSTRPPRPPFVQLNCAALPEGLIESALFGHEKGAFTGAVKRVEGAFERAHRGTLLLDEISEMRLDLQAKLLRVLQEQEFERVGGTQPIKVDVRIIATTNRDLAAEAAAGTFRQDLFYRLSVIPVSIPPLRDRREDVPLLATRFALRVAEETGKRFEGIAPEAMAVLQGFAWPGNVRELQHVIERAVILSPEPGARARGARPGAVRAHRGRHRRARRRRGGRRARPPTARRRRGGGDPMRVVLRSLDVNEAERVLIERALVVAEGNRTRASELLGISVRTLRNKLNGPGREP